MSLRLKALSAKRERRSPMDVKEFDEFVKREQEAASGVASVDWDGEREEWLGYLDKLYKKVESLLDKYISSGQIQRERRPVKLNEEHLGSYVADQLVLKKIGRASCRERENIL